MEAASDHSTATPERDGAEAPPRLSRLARVLVLLVVPLLLVGPSLLPDHRFLPQAPVQYEPLASENPEAAAAAERGANRYTGDRVFPALSDQLELRRRLAAGESWTWEDGWGLGAPLVGNAIHGPYYPPNLLGLALPPDRAAAPLAILTLFLAGLGAWCFLARRGLVEPACLVAALCYQGTGWGVVNLHYAMKVDAALWLPWCLWALDGWRRGDRRGLPCLALFAGAALLAGFPPIAGFALAAAGAVAALWSLGDALRGAPARTVLARVAAPAGALALGVLLAGVQLVPTAAAAADSPRSAATPTTVAANALPLATLATAAVPNAFGPPTVQPPEDLPLAAWLAPAGRGDAALGANGLEWNTHAGLLAFALACVGLVTAGRRAIVPGLVLALAFAWAQDWPGARVLYWTPGLNGGLPTRALSVAWFAWAWLAALGVDRVVRSRAAAGAALVVTGGLVTAIATVRATALPSPETFWSTLAARHDLPVDAVRQLFGEAAVVDAFEHLARALALSGAVFALLATALAVLRFTRASLLVAAGVLAVAFAVELFVVSRPHIVPREVGDGPLFPDSPALEAVARAAGEGRVLRWAPNGLGDVIHLARPNLLQVYGVRDASAYIAFQPRATAAWFATIDPRFVVAGGVAALPALHLLDDPRLDEAGITCILSPEPLTHERLKLEYDAHGFFVYRRRNDLAPDAWLDAAPRADGADPRARAASARTNGALLSLFGAALWVVLVHRLARRRASVA